MFYHHYLCPHNNKLKLAKKKKKKQEYKKERDCGAEVKQEGFLEHDHQPDRYNQFIVLTLL